MEYLCVNHSTLFSLSIKFDPFNQGRSTSATFFLPFVLTEYWKAISSLRKKYMRRRLKV